MGSNTINKKFKLHVKQGSLKLFFFVVRPRDNYYDGAEKLEGVYAYNLNKAVDLVMDKYVDPQDELTVNIKHVDTIPAEEIVDSIDDNRKAGNTTITWKLQKETPIKEVRQVNKDRFINGLKLCRERYGKKLTKTDNQCLTRVINKLEKLIKV